MNRPFVVSVALVTLLALAGIPPASAGTWKVGRAPDGCDGPCNFHDLNSGGVGFGIRQAMLSLEVLPGDTVMVWPGVYPGKVTMKSGVVLTSRYGPDDTILQGSAGAEAAIAMVATSAITAISGLTFRWDSSEQGLGGGIAAFVSSGSVRGNVFRSNRAGVGSGIYLQSSDILIDGNLFVSNNCASGGGTVAVSGGSPTIRSNTFSANYAPFGYEGAALYATGSDFVFDRNIVHGSEGASAVFCGGGNLPTVSCNLFWANALGPFAGQCVDSVGTSGNIAADPLFCNAAGGDFGVCADSPALTGPCGRIGYTSPGGDCAPCRPTAVAANLEAVSWGRLKSAYR